MYKSNHLCARLHAASAQRGDDIFVQGAYPRSFAQFFNNAERHASALLSMGLRPGDRVALQVEKSIEAIELYIGTILAGGVFLPLNPAYTPDEISYFLHDATPFVFVSDPESGSLATPATKVVAHVLTLDAKGQGSLMAGLPADSHDFTTVARSGDDLAAILYTSGTTGRSKGAMLSHRALASNAAVLAKYWRFTPQDVLIHALPIFHTHGLFVAINTVLMVGASMIFQPRFDAKAVIAAMPEASVLMGVPTFYTRLLGEADLAAASKNMRVFISGSAPLLAETHAAWQASTGHAILERYGMTETNMNTSNPYVGARKPGTVGTALPGVEVKITDAKGNTLPTGATGVIEVRGENVFSGYWQMPGKTSQELRKDGWFITGDLGVQDEQGYISIVGRAKDMIISGGFNVYPKEVEDVLNALPEVCESAVIGIAHPDFGEGVVAVLVLAEKTDFDQSAVGKYLAKKLANYKCPKRIYIVDSLPRNAMGKVQKKAMRAEYARCFT
ncbi:MAG: AMP-binding protein [Paracoccaceae bacterium]